MVNRITREESIRQMVSDLETQLMRMIDERTERALQTTRGKEGARVLVESTRAIGEELEAALDSLATSH
jgi:hypothetical protein